MERIFELASFLSQLPSVGGMELDAADAVKNYCESMNLFDEIRIIPTGTVLAYCRSGKKHAKTLLLDAHLDEIGFVVTNVFDDGFVSVTGVGGIDTRVLSASEVTIYGKEPVKGVFTSKPPHLQVAGEQNKTIDIKDLYIDTGLDGKHLKELVRIGNLADMNGPIERLQGSRIVSKAMDDKICMSLIIRAAELIKQSGADIDICCQFSTGEETGYSGATTGTFAAAPDYAIAIDVCNPRFPEGDKSREHIDLGKGGVISYSGTTCRSFTKKLLSCAERNGFSYVLKADPGRTGTNAHVTAISREGIPTALISIPLRYMHTASEVIDLSDCLETAKLIAAFVKELGGED